MNVGMISRRYAKALLGYAVAEKAEDKIYSEAKTLAKSFSDVPRLRTAMDNPTLTVEDKLGLIKAAAGSIVSPVFMRFIQLVLKNKREKFLQSMALSYADIYCESKYINTGKLVTATPVDKSVITKMKALVQRVKPGELDFEVSVDSSIQGGFILFVDTYRYDASVRTQLSRIKQQLIAHNGKNT